MDLQLGGEAPDSLPRKVWLSNTQRGFMYYNNVN